jgi:hypothetical protein
MLITLLLAAACALLAWSRRRSWWKWALAGAAIDLGLTILLAVAARQLGIDVRSRSGGTTGNVAAWVVIVLPRIVALLTVFVSTRRPAAPDSRQKRRERARQRR